MKNFLTKGKGFLIAGTNSGIGKTTVSMGLMKAISRNYNLSPFKVGPDYIDGKFHEYATGNKSYNLDFFLMGENGVKQSFVEHHKDFSIVEGVMGLYDGIDNSLDNGSSAHISRILNLPVVLVVDGVGKSTSIAAQVMGYQNFDKRVNIIGVIINKVSSEKTYKILKEAIEKYCNIKCFGYIPKLDDISVRERHLGLIQADEIENLNKKIEKLEIEIRKTVDIDLIYRTAEISEKISFISEKLPQKYSGLTMGIAKDNGFSFYYNDNIEFLEKLGVKIKYFSPINDKKTPENLDILYFGGGYPENFCEELKKNISMKKSIQDFHEKNGVIYGECGGFIYLSQKLITVEGKKYEFVGLIDTIIEMTSRLNIGRFGYINIEYKGFHGKGHEFHYSKIKDEGTFPKVLKITKPDKRNWECGYVSKNLLCGYPHIHFFQSREIIFDLLDRALKYKEQRDND